MEKPRGSRRMARTRIHIPLSPGTIASSMGDADQ
jgi:hypothetical protein